VNVATYMRSLMVEGSSSLVAVMPEGLYLGWIGGGNKLMG